MKKSEKTQARCEGLNTRKRNDVLGDFRSKKWKFKGNSMEFLFSFFVFIVLDLCGFITDLGYYHVYQEEDSEI